MPAPLGNKNAVGNHGGRPTLYREEFVKIVQEITNNKRLPLVEDVELKLHITPQVLSEWSKAHVEFGEAIAALKGKQRRALVKNALSNKYNARFAQFLLSANHGMREGQDLTTNGKEIALTVTAPKGENSPEEVI